MPDGSELDLITRRTLLGSAVSLCAAVRRLAAQDPTFSTDVKVVNVLATVRYKQGQVVNNLTKDDFTIEEDGRPQTIRYFARETDLPLTLGLLIDRSGSQRRLMGEERTASRNFLEQVLREDKDMAFVIHFDREVELLQDLTFSPRQLEKALDDLEAPQMQRPQWGGAGRKGPQSGGGGMRRRGGTSLYDAVLLASDELMKKQSGRKALILLSDGVDNASCVTLDTAVEAAQRSDTLVYSILFKDEEAYSRPMSPGRGWGGGGRSRGWGGGPSRYPQNRPDGKKVLEQISNETGGGFFEVSKKRPLDQIYARIEEDLRSQYNLGFTPDRKEPGFRRIRLTTKNKGLVVQSREGYYSAG